MKVKNTIAVKNQGAKVKCLTLILASLALTACSEEQKDQAKEAVAEKVEVAKEAVAEKVEVAKEAVAEKVEVAKEAVTEKVEVAKEAVTEKVEVVKEAVTEVTPTLEKPAPEVSKAVTSDVPVEPQTHIIKAAVTQFRPLVVFANPGDKIVWQNMAGHDTTSMKGMVPEGAEGWQSKMGEVFSVTVEKEGAYLYKCSPHATMGMMGAIIVGNSDNLEAIKAGVDASGEPKGMVKRVIRKVEKKLSKK